LLHPPTCTNLANLSDPAQKNGSEAERLLKSTVDEIKDVLQRKTEEAENLAAQSSGGKN
jgi:hypothetical protein